MAAVLERIEARQKAPQQVPSWLQEPPLGARLKEAAQRLASRLGLAKPAPGEGEGA
jgi:hypothetical protein